MLSIFCIFAADDNDLSTDATELFPLIECKDNHIY